MLLDHLEVTLQIALVSFLTQQVSQLRLSVGGRNPRILELLVQSLALVSKSVDLLHLSLNHQ